MKNNDTAITTKIKADIRALLSQGANPTKFSSALAKMRRVSVDEIDAVIAEINGTPRVVSEHVIADERRYAPSKRSASWRRYGHEED